MKKIGVIFILCMTPMKLNRKNSPLMSAYSTDVLTTVYVMLKMVVVFKIHLKVLF